MSGPWEKFQSSSASDEGPWQRYRGGNSNAARPGAVEGGFSAAAQGAFFGAGDEINAGLSAVLGAERQQDGTYSYLNYDKPMAQRYDEELAKSRGVVEQFREDRPVASTALEVAGSLVVPGAAARSVKQAAAIGAGGAAAYEFNSGEGGAQQRLDGVPQAAATGVIFGAGLQAVGNGLRAGARRAFSRAEKRPTLQTLRAAKNAAYQAVEREGHTFSQQDMQNLFRDVVSDVAEANYVPEADIQTKAALKILEGRSNSEVTLGQLDKIRQNLWSRFGRADNEVGILDAISRIDDLIASKADASEGMAAARLANSQYRKAELLEIAFQKASDQAASTGSGGNILNKYRQAVTSIINNPRQAKWFSGEELDVMRAFVHGDVAENVLRRVGKLSPGGNGLMTALNLAAVSVDPGFLAATAAGVGAKEVADGRVRVGAEQLQNMVSTGRMPAVPNPATTPANAAGNLAGQANRDQ